MYDTRTRGRRDVGGWNEQQRPCRLVLLGGETSMSFYETSMKDACICSKLYALWSEYFKYLFVIPIFFKLSVPLLKPEQGILTNSILTLICLMSLVIFQAKNNIFFSSLFSYSLPLNLWWNTQMFCVIQIFQWSSKALALSAGKWPVTWEVHLGEGFEL